MRQSQVRAWILLAVPDEPEPLSYVLGMADGLNKAIPKLDELRDSLGWLQAADLIAVDAGEFQRTAIGRGVISECQVEGDTAFGLWDKVESALQTICTDGAVPYDLTADELQAAYDEYHRWFRATYK